MIAALLAGLYVAWTIGANDAPNAIAPAVAAGALPFWWALLLAAVCEALGAAVAGVPVSTTLTRRLIDLRAVDPSDAALGMISALVASGVWLHAGLLLRVPVSTTQSVVGGLVGATLGLSGGAKVAWWSVAQVAVAWVLAPALAALLAYGLLRVARHAVRRAGGLAVAVMAAGGAGIGAVVAFQLGASGWAMAGAALSVGLLTAGVARGRGASPWQRLHVLSAAYLAFAHGANDAANAVGPLAVVYGALRGLAPGATPSISTPMVLLVVTGIVIGLLTSGYRVIATVGKGITHLTPVSGFTAVMTAAVVTVAGTGLGVPLSTTHVILGSVLGVGAARGVGAVNLPVLKEVLVAWALTAPLSALLAAGLAAALR